MSRGAAFSILAVSLVLAAGIAVRNPLSSGGSGVSSAARLEVDAGLRMVPVGDVLGAVVNEHYWSPADSVHPDWHDQYLGRTITRMQELAPVNGRKFAIRFGHTPTDGSWGKDGYHWLDAFDERAWATSIDEFMEYVGRVGGEPYVGVNFGSGTAHEAAGFVSYVNGTDLGDPYVQLRHRHGRPEPYNVRYWIIGFEQYGQWETGYWADRPYDFANPAAPNGGDPEWHGRPSLDPKYFADRAATFAQRMRAASPTPIKLYVPLNNWDLAYWGGREQSARTILPVVGPVIDGVTVHYYPMNPAYGETDVDLLGRPETLAQSLDVLRALLIRFGPPGRQLEIGDVEYNNRSSSNDQTQQLVNGLFVADTLRVLASKGVSSAFYFAISAAVGNGSGFTYFSQGDIGQPMPTYLATQLVARHLGTEVVKSDLSGSRVVMAPGGSTGGFTYPSLTALASLSADHMTLYLVVINKHLAYDQEAEVALHGVSVSEPLEITTLNGPSPAATAHNARLSQTSGPSGASFSYTFPAHSVTGMRIALSSPPR